MKHDDLWFQQKRKLLAAYETQTHGSIGDNLYSILVLLVEAEV